MSQQIPFQQVDVFTQKPFKGNPVAVILDGNGLRDREMQTIANWTHLSETTFVCRPTNPEGDYRLRIFTPASELSFAGHPTIGSAEAVLKHGIRQKHANYLVQECGEGLIKIYLDGNQRFLTMPTPKIDTISEKQLSGLADSLGIPTSHIKINAIVDVGATWFTLQLTDASEVLRLKVDNSKLKPLIPAGVTGVTVFGLTSDSEPTDMEVRSFAPTEGVDEDPVCGSGNGCVAILVKRHHLLNRATYLASQGACLGRDGRIEIRFSANGQVLVGGHAVTCIQGNLTI